MLSKEVQRLMLSRISSGIVGKKSVVCRWINSGKELGYTRQDESDKPATIYVAWEQKTYFAGLTEDEAFMLRSGIAAHETLHQCFTDFDYTNTIAKKLKRREAMIFMHFANTIEDPAIEYHAPKVMSGWFLDALRFSIKRIYELSPTIDDSANAYMQLINALIHFGDVGFIKGNFTFPEAKKYFLKIAPIYNKAILCLNARKRIDYALECMEITKPLWEETLKNDEDLEQELHEDLVSSLNRSGSPSSELADNPSEESEDLENNSDETSDEFSSEVKSNRDELVEAIKKAMEEAKENAEDTEDTKSEEDSTECVSSESSDSENSDDENTSDEADSTGSGEGTSTGSEDDEKYDSEKSGGSSKSSSDKEGTSSEDGEGTNNPSEDEPSKEIEIDNTKVDEILDGLTSKEASKLKNFEVDINRHKVDIDVLTKAVERVMEKENPTTPVAEVLPDFDEELSKGAYTTKNQLINTNLSEYKYLVGKLKPQIDNMTKKLERIFDSDTDGIKRATSGKYNIHRGSIGTSVKIFDKFKEKSNKKNVEVMLLVDHSGSMMWDYKMEEAKIATTIFAESLAKLNVPFYVLGFSADRYSCDAYHLHYVTWDNSFARRSSIANFEADGNNFDGYSIRYATELLNRHQSNAKKILIILSDGQPAARAYTSVDKGVADTTAAIRDAKKSCKVCGIGIGNCNPNTLQKMYDGDFIHLEKVNLLANLLGKKLVKILK